MTETKKTIPVGVWQKEKPDYPCVFATATMWRDEFEYMIFQILPFDGEDGNFYLALIDGDNDEWGALEDLAADYYFIFPEIKEQV